MESNQQELEKVQLKQLQNKSQANLNGAPEGITAGGVAQQQPQGQKMNVR